MKIIFQYQFDIYARISMLDFYLERAYILKYISEKQLYIRIKQIIKVIM